MDNMECKKRYTLKTLQEKCKTINKYINVGGPYICSPKPHKQKCEETHADKIYVQRANNSMMKVDVQLSEN